MPYIPPPDYSEFSKLHRDRTFQKSMRRAIELQREISEREAELKELKEDVIEPSLHVGGVKINTTVLFDNVPVAVRDVSSGSRISEELLLQNGVRRSVIEKSKIENKRRHYVQIGEERKSREKSKGAEVIDMQQRRARGARD